MFQTNGQIQKYSQFEKDTVKQTLECAMKLWPKATSIPAVYHLQQLPENSETLNQVWGCIWTEKGLIDEDGSLHENNLINFIRELIKIRNKGRTGSENQIFLEADEIANTCKTMQGINLGSTAVKVQNCINNYVSL